MSRFVVAGKVSDIPEQSAKRFELGGKTIALFNLGGSFYAIDDTCTHEGGPLSEGMIHGEQVECPWHGAHFEIKTGRVALDPATEAVARYNVRVVGENIEVEL